jgi:cyclopropane fatty-acyl-phospholipid synthase-like methyltransferase
MENEAVRAGYDRIAQTYDAQRDQFRNILWLERFLAMIPPGRAVLDVGCGAGRPVDAYLVDHGYAVHGLDFSPAMIELARGHVPGATYAVQDMLDLKPGEYRVDGIVALYSIFHTPRERHQELLDTLASYLSPGGAMLITMGASEWEGEEEFHGVRMSWSHFGAARNVEMVESAGCRVLVNEIDHSGDEQHQVIIARKSE